MAASSGDVEQENDWATVEPRMIDVSRVAPN